MLSGPTDRAVGLTPRELGDGSDGAVTTTKALKKPPQTPKPLEQFAKLTLCPRHPIARETPCYRLRKWRRHLTWRRQSHQPVLPKAAGEGQPDPHDARVPQPQVVKVQVTVSSEFQDVIATETYSKDSVLGEGIRTLATRPLRTFSSEVVAYGGAHAGT